AGDRDADDRGDATVIGEQELFAALEVGQRSSGTLMDDQPRSGGGQASLAVAVEELHAETEFGFGQAMAESGLGGVQLPCRRAHGAEVDDGHDRLVVAEIELQCHAGTLHEQNSCQGSSSIYWTKDFFWC